MKWKKLRRSKWQFPTYIRRQSQEKGELIHGEKSAIAHIERSFYDAGGGKLQFEKKAHTSTEWVFCVRQGQSFRKPQ